MNAEALSRSCMVVVLRQNVHRKFWKLPPNIQRCKMILDMTRSHIWTQIAEATKNIAIVGRYRIISPNTAPFSAEKRGQKHVYLFTLIHMYIYCL